MKPLMKYHVTLETPEGRTIKTWGVFPIMNTTKVLDGIFNPEAKELSILLDSNTEQYMDYPVRKPNGKYEMQQRKVDQYYRLKITEADLPFFLEHYVANDFEIEPEVTEPSKIIQTV